MRLKGVAGQWSGLLYWPRLGAALAALALSVAATAADEASAPPQLSDVAQLQMRALTAIKAARTPVQNKIDSRLFLGTLKVHRDERLASLTDFRFVHAEADGRVPVDIVLRSPTGVKNVVDMVEALHGVVESKSARYQRIAARLGLDDLEAIAAMAEVKRVRQHIPALANAANVSEGDKTHGADETRGFFGVAGAGQKVCAISDGVDSLAALQASGDLPATVDVLPGQAGSGNEGAAMLEIIHDLAPAAQLGFATANPDEATFAQNILDLAAAGCTIIVDDIIYLDESPFEDGPVAQAVNTVTGNGVLYFSSAGNEGNKDDGTSGTWEGDFVPNGTPPALAGAGPVHNFGDGGQSVLVTNGGGNPPLLIWAEHYDLATGNASTDYDLYDMDGGLSTVLDASTDVQDGVGGDDFPIEFIGGGTFTGERLVVAKLRGGTTSSAPMFNLIVFRGRLDNAVSTSGATRGHSAALNAFSVAATPAKASFDGASGDGPFPGLFTGANHTESFSSDGPRRILLDASGAELTPGNRTATGGVVRQKPDLTAADGVSTAAPGFNPFYGTSAAAPHAAAIAALLKSASGTLTPAQVRTALVGTALDIEAPGTDRDSGAGIVMPHAALNAIGGSPQAYFGTGSIVPTQVAGDGDAFVENNETWALSIPLTNSGGAGASAISAVLTTSTPGVTIVGGSSAYTNAAIGATVANTTPYAFAVGAAAPCGGTIDFTLTVTYSGGSGPQTFHFTQRIGAPGTPQSFAYAGPVVPIPDGLDLTGNAPGAPGVATVAVSGVAGNVYSVSASIDGATCSTAAGASTVGIDHSFVNDLEISLVGPDATAVKVIDNTDGSGNNFCQTVLDDASAGASIQSVVTANAPFTGSFKPANALSAFAGRSANGNWKLQAQDFYSQDSGSIRAYTVTITPAVCNAPVQTSGVSGAMTVTGTFLPNGNVSYTVTLHNSGAGTQGDNPGDEFTDVLPAQLTLLSATASSGTAVATVGTNTVGWNGTIPPGATVTITIQARVSAGAAAGATITNQGSIAYDADGNGTNESSASTDDPALAGASDATSFGVVSGLLAVAPTTVQFGAVVTDTTSRPSTVTLSNSGSGPLTVNGIDAPAAPFTRSAASTCPAPPFVLAQSTSCTLVYTYTPTTLQISTQVLNIRSDGGASTLALNGAGMAPPVPVPALSAFGRWLLALALFGLAAARLRRRSE